MALQQIVQETVTGLGYDLVEIDRTAGGLLRITIDWPWQPGSELFINVEDCEKVNRQLQFALEVDGVAYNRQPSKSTALPTTGSRCPLPELTAPCVMKKILSALPER